MQRLYAPKFTSLLLRIGLAFAFFYAAVASFVSPQDWVGYFPLFMRDIIPGTILLPIFSGIELFLAIWLILGWYVRFSALIAALMLIGIVVVNLSLLSVVFRDVSLAIMALALYTHETTSRTAAR